MIRFQDLALRRGAKSLFAHVSLQIGPQDHIGLVGDNGAGKSSLFALLRGELLADAGEFELPARWRVAHVAQATPHSERAATDFVIDGDVELRATEADLAEAEARHDGHTAGLLHARLADQGAYTARARAQTLLLGLGFTPAQLEAPVNSFSGGWRMRLALAQTLMRPSELLLLDEPTNHLDLDAIVWLEDWLRRYPGTLIVISHDRDFLDAVAQAILHIDNGAIKRYGGNYSSFERERALQLSVQQSAFERQQQEIAHLQSFIDRFKAKATKAKQAQSRVKALERMELIAPAHAAAPLHFTFFDPDTSPSPMLVAEDLACGYGDTRILSGVNLVLVPGQRIGLLGANGQGKSTLIRTLVGELPRLAGDLRLGKGLRIGYFAQHEVERLRPTDTPLEHLARIARDCAPQAREQELRDFLGRFDFPGPMAAAPIAPFSGGEKARLALASIVYTRPNLLLLDEPTNHLDLETRHALTMALAQFEGTLLVVSHDRHLLRSTTDQFYLVADGRVDEYVGDLDDYRGWLLERSAQRRSAGDASDSLSGAANRRAQRKEEAAERQRLAAQRKPIERDIAKLEHRMEHLSAEKARLEALLADEALYAPERKADLAQALRDQAAITGELETVEAAWLERQEALQWVR